MYFGELSDKEKENFSQEINKSKVKSSKGCVIWPEDEEPEETQSILTGKENNS